MAIALHARVMPSSSDALREAFITVLRRKGRAIEAAANNVASVRGHLNMSDRKTLVELDSIRSELANMGTRLPNKIDPKVDPSGFEARAQDLESAIASRSAHFRVQSEPVSLEQIQRAIPEGAVLVELVAYRSQNFQTGGRGEGRYAAYVLRNKGGPQGTDLGEAAGIDNHVSQLRAALRDPTSKDFNRRSRMLDDDVMRPVRKFLGDSRHILISTDGALNLIPFGALVDEEDHYLIEKYSFSYLTSGRDLLRFQEPSPPGRESVIFTDPLFDLAAGAGTKPLRETPEEAGPRSLDFSRLTYPPLPATAEEAKQIAAVLPRASVFARADATEGNLKQVKGPTILHIATHGFFLPDRQQESLDNRTLYHEQNLPGTFSEFEIETAENPLLRSGLVLAGVKQLHSGIGEDGVFTALEAAGLDLIGTRLVVLSACDTGLGQLLNGEGVDGLRRALFIAGAESQVISLWAVSDTATRDLMVGFYKRLQAGEGRTEALRQAQLTMMASSGRSHPFYWAAFIQSGNWAPVDLTGNPVE